MHYTGSFILKQNWMHPLYQSAINPFITSKENAVPERDLNLAHMSKYYAGLNSKYQSGSVHIAAA